MNVESILIAMRGDCVPAGEAGRWTVVKRRLKKPVIREISDHDPTPPGSYTWLFCLTTETMMKLPGEVVMNDFPSELKKHLEFVIRATGKVLIGGLGLGCVVRGLLARGQVTSIDIIERSTDVIKLCAKSVEDERVTIHQRDAYSGFVKGGPWDWVWWDLWSDPEKSEPHLAVIHAALMNRFYKRAGKQGAWAFPRRFKQSYKKIGVHF